MSTEKRRIVIVGNPTNEDVNKFNTLLPNSEILIFEHKEDEQDFKKEEKFRQLTFNPYKAFSESKDFAGERLKRNDIYNYNDLQKEYKLILDKKSKLGYNARNTVKYIYEKIENETRN